MEHKTNDEILLIIAELKILILAKQFSLALPEIEKQYYIAEIYKRVEEIKR